MTASTNSLEEAQLLLGQARRYDRNDKRRDDLIPKIVGLAVELKASRRDKAVKLVVECHTVFDPTILAQELSRAGWYRS